MADVLNLDSGLLPESPKPRRGGIDRDRILQIARADKIPDDIADDFAKVMNFESGGSHYNRRGKVKLSPPDPKTGERAVGAVQIKPSTAREMGVNDPFDEESNIRAGLRYFAKGGSDPAGRRIHYFGGPKPLKSYQRTGRIPKGRDVLGTTFQKYIQSTGGQQKTNRIDISAGLEQPSYDTKLNDDEERQFQQWKKKYAPKDSGADYDLRGAFRAGLVPDPKNGHWPDTFKKPNHPTFSNESKYATGENAARAGRWQGEKFIPPIDLSAGLEDSGQTPLPKNQTKETLIPQRAPSVPKKPKGPKQLDYAEMRRQMEYGPDPSIAEVKRAEDLASYGQPGINVNNIDPRILKGEQPKDRLAHQRAMDMQARRVPLPTEKFETVKPAFTARKPGWIERAKEVVAPYVPEGLASIDTPGGIKTDLPRGAVRGLTLGAIDPSRTVTPEERILNPAAETEKAVSEGIGETATAVVPFLGAGRLISKLPALQGATRLSAAARTGLTFGSVEAARQAIQAGKTGELNPEEIVISSAIGAAMGAIPAARNPTVKSRLVAALTPQALADYARGVPIENAVQNAITNLVFEAHGVARERGLREGQIEAQPDVTAQPEAVESAQAAASNVPARSVVDRGNVEAITNRGGESETAQRYYHKDWGEVEVLADQSGARPGRVKVAEVADPTRQHYPKRADLSGRGNQRMVPVRQQSEVANLESGLVEPAEAPPKPPAETPVVVKSGAAQPTPMETTASTPELSDRPDGGFQVKTDSGSLIVRPIVDQEGRPTGDFESFDVYVEPAARRQGVATSLYREAQAEAERRGGKLLSSEEQTPEGQALQIGLRKAAAVERKEIPPLSRATAGGDVGEVGGEPRLTPPASSELKPTRQEVGGISTSKINDWMEERGADSINPLEIQRRFKIGPQEANEIADYIKNSRDFTPILMRQAFEQNRQRNPKGQEQFEQGLEEAGQIRPPSREEGLENLLADLKSDEPVEQGVEAPRKFPELREGENYRKPLKDYADTFYREASPSKALEMLPTSRITTDVTSDQIFLSNTPDLALGQEQNKGILLEFEPRELQGRVNTSKPAWKPLYDQGQAEFVAQYNRQGDYQQAVKAVTIRPDAKMSRVERAQLNTALKDMEAQGWTKTETPEGIRYEAPTKPSEQRITNPFDDLRDTPESERGTRRNLVYDLELPDNKKLRVIAYIENGVARVESMGQPTDHYAFPKNDLRKYSAEVNEASRTAIGSSAILELKRYLMEKHPEVKRVEFNRSGSTAKPRNVSLEVKPKPSEQPVPVSEVPKRDARERIRKTRPGEGGFAAIGAAPRKVGPALADAQRAVQLEPPSVRTRLLRGAKLLPQRLQTALTSEFTPLRRLEREVLGTPPQLDLARKFEQVAGASAKAEADFIDFKKGVVEPIRQQTDDFNSYLFLKRVEDRLIKDPEQKRVADWTLEKARQGLTELKDVVGPDTMKQFDEIARVYQQSMRKALQLQVDSGRMSPELFDKIVEANDFYAPFKVLKYIEQNESHGAGRRIATLQDLTKKITGIDSKDFQVGNILQTSAEQIMRSRILAEKNLKMQELGRLADLDTTKKLIRKVDPNDHPEPGFEHVKYFENGEPVTLEVSSEVARTIQGMNAAQASVVTRAAMAVRNTFRWGATSANVGFQPVNLFFADLPRSALISKYGVQSARDLYKFPLDWGYSLFTSMKGNFGKPNALFMDWLRSGAANSTIQREITPDVFRPKPISPGKTHPARRVLDSIAKFSNAIEETSKILTLKRGKEIENFKNLEPEQQREAIERIAAEVRNYGGSPDFLRRGSETRNLNLLFMFFNARVQGMASDIARLAGKTGRREGAAAWARLGAAVGVPATALALVNQLPQYRDDYDRIPEWEKKNYFMIPRESYFTNEDTGEQVRDYWRIPKRDIVQLFANTIESAVEFGFKRDPKAAKKWAGDMLEGLSPINIEGDDLRQRGESVLGSVNPAIKVPAEVLSNRDFFRKRDIVPEYMKKAEPAEQYRESTPRAYRVAGRALGVSPLRLEHATQGLTGGGLTQFSVRKPREGRSPLSEYPLFKRFFRSGSVAEDRGVSPAEQEQATSAVRRYRARNEIIEKMRKGEKVDLNAEVSSGRIMPADRSEIRDAVKMSPRQKRFSDLPPLVALERYEKMSQTQKLEMLQIMRKKAKSIRESKVISRAQKDELRPRLNALGLSPYAGVQQ